MPNNNFDSRKDKVNFVFILPNVAIYLKHFFDYISEKQIQIYASFSDQVKIQMVVTCYFPPERIAKYIEEQLPEAILKLHGNMRFKERIKPNKRPYTKRKIKAPIAQPQPNGK